MQVAHPGTSGRHTGRGLSRQAALLLGLVLGGLPPLLAREHLLDWLPWPAVWLFGVLCLAPFYLLAREPGRAKGAGAAPPALSGNHEATGFPERAFFMDRLNRLLALNNRDQRQTVVMYVGLQGFERLVEALGAAGGATVLHELADRLAESLRNADTITRMNKSELVVVLGGDVRDDDVVVVIGRIQRECARPVPVPGGALTVSACVGVACFPADGVSGEILIQNSYLAMIQAREQAEPFNYYSPSLNRKALERLTVEARMLRGLEQGEYFLVYQPQYARNGRTVSGVEALLRWRRAGVLVMPDTFIPVAEHNGMIVRLGEWVLKEACRQGAAWRAQGRALPVSVNVSNSQLRTPEFVERVERVLSETGLDPGLLELEITENDLLCLSDDLALKLLRLKEVGVKLAIDNFGAGYSSLACLKDLPVDRVKIDRSLVSDLVADRKAAAVADAIIAMARALNLSVTAQGVENREQLELLRGRGCSEFQGFYFSQPVDAEAVLRLLPAEKGGRAAPEPVAERERDEPGGAPPAVSGPEPAGTEDERRPEPAEYMRDVALAVTPISPQETLIAVLARFQFDRGLKVLPVVDAGRIVGIVNRAVFYEEHIIGRQGYAAHINHAKKIRDLMEPVRLVFDAKLRIEEAAAKLQPMVEDLRVDNICIASDGVYAGVIDVSRIFKAMTEIQLSLAKGANPLSGLPGNVSIERQINRRLEGGSPFDVAYIDIDNFKPYNDHYGFQKGDEVIKRLAEIVLQVVGESSLSPETFCGHIGGDDFILITEAFGAVTISQRIVALFDLERVAFHGELDFAAAGYYARNRKGEFEQIPLLSISVGIVSTSLTPVGSYAGLASLSTEVKKAAKKRAGSSIAVEGAPVEAPAETSALLDA